MIATYTAKLRWNTQQINIWIHQINNSIIETIKIILARYQIENKFGKVYEF